MEKRRLPAVLLTLLLVASLIVSAGTSVKAWEAETGEKGNGTNLEETETESEAPGVKLEESGAESEKTEAETGSKFGDESEERNEEKQESVSESEKIGIQLEEEEVTTEETEVDPKVVVDQPVVNFVATNKVGKAAPFTDEDFQVIMKSVNSSWGTNVEGVDIVPGNANFKVDWSASTLQMGDIWGSQVSAYKFSRDSSGKLILKNVDHTVIKAYKKPDGGRDVWGDCTWPQWNFFEPSATTDWGMGYKEQYEFNYPVDESSDDFPDLINISAWYNPSEFNEDGEWGTGDRVGVMFIVGKEDSVFHFKEETETPPVIAEDYILDVSKGNAVLSKEEFAAILQENQTKNVVIKTNDDVIFTFKAGTMKAVEGKENYDFSVVINRDYGTAPGLPQYITNNQFVLKIDYNYSGMLPAEASIRIYAGKNYAGRTLYYGQLMSDTSISSVQPVVVDENGYITVQQDHCSSYILTSTEPKAVKNEPSQTDRTSTSQGNGNQTQKTDSKMTVPKTGDSAMFWLYGILAISAIAVVGIIKCRVSKK